MFIYLKGIEVGEKEREKKTPSICWLHTEARNQDPSIQSPAASQELQCGGWKVERRFQSMHSNEGGRSSSSHWWVLLHNPAQSVPSPSPNGTGAAAQPGLFCPPSWFPYLPVDVTNWPSMTCSRPEPHTCQWVLLPGGNKTSNVQGTGKSF